jgi:hypothetical protein
MFSIYVILMLSIMFLYNKLKSTDYISKLKSSDYISKLKYLLNVWIESRKNKAYWSSSVNNLVVDYVYDDKEYKIIIPTISEESDSFFSTQPVIVQAKWKTITDVNNNKVNINQYLGPSRYSNYLTSKMLGYHELIVDYANDEQKMFMDDSVINLV